MSQDSIWYQFHTISEYVKVLADLSLGVELRVNQKVSKVSGAIPESFNQKKRLIDLTYRNISLEKEQISSDPEFAFLCCSWIASKGYYLLFTQQCLLLYLLTLDERHVNFDHKPLRKCFDGKLYTREIAFNHDIFNQVRLYKQAYHYTTPAGSIFSKTSSEKLGLILKKNVKSAEEDFKRTSGIKDFRSKVNKDKKE